MLGRVSACHLVPGAVAGGSRGSREHLGSVLDAHGGCRADSPPLPLPNELHDSRRRSLHCSRTPVPWPSVYMSATSQRLRFRPRPRYHQGPPHHGSDPYTSSPWRPRSAPIGAGWIVTFADSRPKTRRLAGEWEGRSGPSRTRRAHATVGFGREGRERRCRHPCAADSGEELGDERQSGACCCAGSDDGMACSTTGSSRRAEVQMGKCVVQGQCTRPVHREIRSRCRRGGETGSRGTSEPRSKDLAGKPEVISSI